MRLDRFLDGTEMIDPRPVALSAIDDGWDGVFTAETSHDPFSPLAIVTTTEPRLTIGTGIAVAFARSPMVTAQAAWDLALRSEGNFLLGLGTQVRAHIVHRFAAEWSAPVARMRDYLGALRAIFAAFRSGGPLRYRSDAYTLSLLTPFFRPEPADVDIPIMIAAVGPGMLRLAGESADGVVIHPFHTAGYLDRVVDPAVMDGAVSVGRDPSSIQRLVTAFVVTGEDDRQLTESMEQARRQIAFYASTPAYRPVLADAGWDVGDRLHELSRRQDWEAMAELVSDDMVEEVAIVAEPGRVAAAVEARYAHRIDRLSFVSTAAFPDGLVADIRRQVAGISRTGS